MSESRAWSSIAFARPIPDGHTIACCLSFSPGTVATGASGFTKATVQSYRAEIEARGLSASAVNVQLAAIRKLASKRPTTACLPPRLAAGIAKVPGARSEGSRAGNWLTRDQASRLLSLPDAETLKGKRDRAILGLLLGCGLRRDELVRLTVEEVQQREGRWVIVDILGKGRRRRTVPVPRWVKTWIDEWTTGGQPDRRLRFPGDQQGRPRLRRGADGQHRVVDCTRLRERDRHPHARASRLAKDLREIL